MTSMLRVGFMPYNQFLVLFFSFCTIAIFVKMNNVSVLMLVKQHNWGVIYLFLFFLFICFFLPFLNGIKCTASQYLLYCSFIFYNGLLQKSIIFN